MSNINESKKQKQEAYEALRKSVKAKCRRGDNALVADMTGYEPTYVSKVLNGNRNNEEIINAFQKVIEARKELLKKLIDQ